MTPRCPTRVSLSELLNLGYIEEDEVMHGGYVPDDVRIRAERNYAEFMDPRAPRQTRRQSPTVP